MNVANNPLVLVNKTYSGVGGLVYFICYFLILMPKKSILIFSGNVIFNQSIKIRNPAFN